jgi:hypothetical protein
MGEAPSFVSHQELPTECSDFLQICSVDYGADPDGNHVKVIDAMEVPGCSPGVLRSARALRTQRQGEREDEFVFLRKVTVQVRKTYARIA